MPSFTPFPQLQCQFSGCHSQDIYIQSNLSHDWLLLSSVSLLFLFLRSTCNQCCSAFFSSSSSSSVLYLLLDILSCRQLGICCFFCFFLFFPVFFRCYVQCHMFRVWLPLVSAAIGCSALLHVESQCFQLIVRKMKKAELKTKIII